MDEQQTVDLAKALANQEKQTTLSVDSGASDGASVNQDEQYNRKGFGPRGSTSRGGRGGGQRR